MKASDIKGVAIIGAGDMGHGIGQLFLMAGRKVFLYDIKDEFVEKGKGRIDWSLGKLVDKARISQKDKDTFMGNLSTYTKIEEAVKNADLVVEAAPEKLDLKKKIFADLDKYCPKHAILGTNTSNMSINDIASATKRPDKVAGLHFFNPAVLMQLVEIIRGDDTSDETINVLVEITKEMTKSPVVCKKDSPGFIVNRINAPTMLYLHCMLDKKEYEPAKLDAASMMMGMRMGSYELMDFVGLDIAYHSMKYLEDRLSKDYAPTPTMQKLIDEGKLGKKTGQGIYKWPEGGGRPEIDLDDAADFDLMDLLRVQINEGAKVLEEGLASAKDIDIAMKKGMNNPFGPFEMAENADLEELTEFLDGIAKKYGKDVFKAHKWIRDGTIMEKAAGKTEDVESKGSTDELETVVIERNPDTFVTTIWLNKPPMNTFDFQLLDDLSTAFDMLWDDTDTRCIVIRGKANCFSAGADLSGGLPSSPMEFMSLLNKGQYTFKKARDIPKPVIAAIERFAYGGGLELAMNCDIRIAKKSAKMGLTEVTLGLLPTWSGTQNIRRHVGLGRAMELVLTGARITAKRAAKIGLINRYEDDDEFEEEVYKMAEHIAKKCAPIAVALSKRLINQASETPVDIGYQMEQLAGGMIFKTEDLMEGVFAFMQKRDPNFKNE